MPRNVRNFWLEADIDGRRSRFEGGPRSKSGGFTVTVKQRDCGEVTTAGRLYGYAWADGTLTLAFVKADGTRLELTATTRDMPKAPRHDKRHPHPDGASLEAIDAAARSHAASLGVRA